MQSLYLGPVMPADEVRTIEREELRRKLAGGGALKLVMCRPEREFQTKRIPGSIHFETRDEMLAGLKRDDEVEALSPQLVQVFLNKLSYLKSLVYPARSVPQDTTEIK